MSSHWLVSIQELIAPTKKRAEGRTDLCASNISLLAPDCAMVSSTSMAVLHAGLREAVEKKFVGSSVTDVIVTDCGAAVAVARDTKKTRFYCVTQKKNERGIYFYRKTETGAKKVASGDDGMYGYDDLQEMLSEN